MSKKVKDKSSLHIELDIVQRDESYMGRTGCTNDLSLLWSVRYRILTLNIVCELELGKF
jgi:hypothetical protein